MSDTKKRVGVFIDVGNQFYCINKKWEGRKLDYEVYMQICKDFGEITRAFAYGTQIGNSAASFKTALHHIGFEPCYKQIEPGTWYSWNVGLAMDIVRLHERMDIIIVGVSDRNIAPALAWAREKGIQVIVIACTINKDVRDSCDRWIEIAEDMLEDIEKENTEINNVSSEATQ